MGTERDAYDVLQVAPSAHPRVIEAAYLALAVVYGQEDDGSEDSMRRLAEVEGAYAMVRNLSLIHI